MTNWISAEFNEQQELQLPKLDLIQNSPDSDWMLLNLSSGASALFSNAKSTFILNCSASYPIQWKIEGTIVCT